MNWYLFYVVTVKYHSTNIWVSAVARREKKAGIKHSLLKAQKQLCKRHSSSNNSTPTSPEMQTSPDSPQNWAHGVSESYALTAITLIQ